MRQDTKRMIIVDTIATMLKSLSFVALDAVAESLVEIMEDAVLDSESEVDQTTMGAMANTVRHTIELEVTG